MDHVVSTNIKNSQVNDAIDNQMKYYNNSSLAINHIKYIHNC